MAQNRPIFMEEVPDYKIRGGLMHIIWPDLEIVLPVSVMVKGMGSARRVLDQWREGQDASVVDFRSGRH
jgi:hypothetical protein